MLRNVESIRDVVLEVRPSATDPTRVTIEFCTEDGTTLVLPMATGESVIAEGFNSAILEADMRLDQDGRWRNHQYFQLDRESGAENSSC